MFDGINPKTLLSAPEEWHAFVIDLLKSKKQSPHVGVARIQESECRIY